MPLTGRMLIALAVCCTAAVLTGTVLVWGRGGRLRYLLRPAGVLLSEALLLVTVGLVVNREEQFYPTWSALRESGGTAQAGYRTTAGRLDRRLAARAGPRPDAAQELTWRPAGWSGWRLAGPPDVVTPAGYLQHPAWRYSVVLVVGAEPGDRLSAARAAGPAVVVFTDPTAGTAVRTVAATLPAELGHDLRVTEHRWAVVTSAADAALVDRAALAAPGLYPAIAASVRPAALPAGIATTVVRTMPAAIAWAGAQLPPPLAASAPPVRYLPGRPHHPRSPHHDRSPHHARSPRPPDRRADVTRQPSR